MTNFTPSSVIAWHPHPLGLIENDVTAGMSPGVRIEKKKIPTNFPHARCVDGMLWLLRNGGNEWKGPLWLIM
jgi:hypothetical protein